MYVRTDEKLLVIDHVSLSFGDRLILRDVNATITNIEATGRQQGQVICFLGPSGIGKTQLSRIISGLQRPTTGQVLLDHAVLTHKGSVGMVPQNYPLFDWATVKENLAIAGRQGGLTTDTIEHKAAMYVDSFGLKNYVDLYPAALSGGTRQRVAIARQMMCAEHYLVLDEPYSGLDPIMKKKASELILTLSVLDTRNTIIIVTHDILEGLSVSDTVWLMGYEPDPNAPGAFLPGARLVQQFDLAAMGFAWRPDIDKDPQFLEFVNHIKQMFLSLR